MIKKELPVTAPCYSRGPSPFLATVCRTDPRANCNAGHLPDARQSREIRVFLGFLGNLDPVRDHACAGPVWGISRLCRDVQPNLMSANALGDIFRKARSFEACRRTCIIALQKHLHLHGIAKMRQLIAHPSLRSYGSITKSSRFSGNDAPSPEEAARWPLTSAVPRS